MTRDSLNAHRHHGAAVPAGQLDTTEDVMIADLKMQRALDRYHRAGAAGLSELEKTLATVWYFESRVANAGFASFFRSPEGELAGYAPTALRRIGAAPLATLAERANAVFGSAGVPANREERLRRVGALSPEEQVLFGRLEDEYIAYDTDLDALIEAYVTQAAHAPRQP
ncbi:MAG TPA: DUF4375 domain-containing protein [Opitutaceae bacterium]|nr:DUF4375 domain-containing protein [Opitutaceae bacterium]